MFNSTLTISGTRDYADPTQEAHARRDLANLLLARYSDEPLPPSMFEKNLMECPDFIAACRLACRHYRGLGTRLNREWAALGEQGNGAFWYECAEEAEHVAEVYAQAIKRDPQTAKGKMLTYLKKRHLCPYYEALSEDTGEAYAEHLGF